MGAQPEKTNVYAPAGPVIRAFHQSNSFIRGIRGPVGSGKSTACVVEILRRAAAQRASPDGIRRSRWVIARNTFPELRSTTIKTWAEWVPTQYGSFKQDSPIVHRVQTADMDIEVLFMALDREEDANKLLSLELTGAWLNEAREIPKGILDNLTGRVGRYPPTRQGGCSWSGIIMDTNPPDTESWWFKCAEQETPEDWEFFSQPSGLSPAAENIAHLPKNYYRRIMAGKDEDWIKVYVHGEYGFLIEGQAVYKNYRDSVHCAPNPIEPIPNLPLLIGSDFGLTPAAVIGQRAVDGRWRIINEFCTDDTGPTRFAQQLRAFIQNTYPDHEVAAAWGDPAGGAKIDDHTTLEIMQLHTGWRWRPAPTNDSVLRLECVRDGLNRMVDGQPALQISPACKMIRKGFAGGYRYRFMRSGGGVTVAETPDKNEYSHPHDALQYLLLGGGEYRVVLQRDRRPHRLQARVHLAQGVARNQFGE